MKAAEEEEEYKSDELKEDNEQEVDLEHLEAEIKQLTDFSAWANRLGVDSKAKSLLSALQIGFKQLKDNGAAEKVVLFTESRRTQAWLKSFLENNGYANQVVTFNGTNADDASGEIYTKWLENNKQSGRVSGSKQIDLRAAILEQFRDDANWSCYIKVEIVYPYIPS